MNGPRSYRSKVALVAAVISALVAWYTHRGAENSRPVPADNRDTHPSRPRDEGPKSASAADFDFYLLTLSWHPAFCAEGHESKPECRVTQAHPLSIHGLWPEKFQAGAYPHDCQAPRLELNATLARELEDYMPGMQSNLHEHEWRTHGACSGLDGNDYFQHALDLARNLAAALQPTLTTHAGGESSPAELRAAADAHQAGLGASFALQCRTLRDAPGGARGRPFLIEVRQCIDKDGAHGAPGKLLDCASVNRRDQGCGDSFQIMDSR